MLWATQLNLALSIHRNEHRASGAGTPLRGDEAEQRTAIMMAAQASRERLEAEATMEEERKLVAEPSDDATSVLIDEKAIVDDELQPVETSMEAEGATHRPKEPDNIYCLQSGI